MGASKILTRLAWALVIFVTMTFLLLPTAAILALPLWAAPWFALLMALVLAPSLADR